MRQLASGMTELPTINTLDALRPGQSAVLDDGVSLPRLVHRRADGSVVQTAEEARIAELERQLAEVRAALPLPRVGIRSVLPRVERGSGVGEAWSFAPILINTDVVGEWTSDLEGGWITCPRAGVYTVSATYVMICDGEQSYNIVVRSSSGAEKIKVLEGSTRGGAVGGTAAGIVPMNQGERLRIEFRTSGASFLYGDNLNHWTIRQEAD